MRFTSCKIKERREMGNRVREVRIEKGLNQNELAIKAEISSRQLSDIELNKSNPTWKTMVKIAKALEVALNDLL
jgi:DNA-binding XRE family transcriptional regulator